MPGSQRPPGRRPQAIRRRVRRKRVTTKTKLILAATVVLLAVLGWSVIARQRAPLENTTQTRFDAIIVLGAPADRDGNPKPMQLSRVTEAVQEYKRGVASRLILSGGAAHNRFVEAQVMARTAEAQGIPRSAILEEPASLDTLQNACYSDRIMKAHGWGSAEIVTSEPHAPRSGLIFSRLPLKWSIHTAPSLAPRSSAYESLVKTVEVVKTARYLVWARWTEHCEP